MKKVLVPILLLLLAIPSSSALAQPVHGFDVGLAKDKVIVQIGTHVFQNLTGLLSSFQLPVNITASLSGSDASNVRDLFQNAIRAKSPTAAVADFRLDVSSSSFPGCKPDGCPFQWFNITASFSLTGIIKLDGDTFTVDTSWKSFALKDEILIAGVSVNQIGRTYLLDAVLRLLEIPPNPGRVFRTLVNEDTVTKDTYQSRTSEILAFDMSSLSAPVQTWTDRYDFNTRQTIWKLDSGPHFSVTGIGTVFEPEGTVNLAYEVASRSSAQVSAPGVASSVGDTIFIETGLSAPIVMIAIVASLGVLGLGSFLADRRVGKIRYKRKK